MLDAGLPDGLIQGTGDVPYARTMAFNTLVLFQLWYAVCIHSDTESSLHAVTRNRWLMLAIVGSLMLQDAVIYLPALQRAFGTVALVASDWLICLAVSFTVALGREGLKAWRRCDRNLPLVAKRL